MLNKREEEINEVFKYNRFVYPNSDCTNNIMHFKARIIVYIYFVFSTKRIFMKCV